MSNILYSREIKVPFNGIIFKKQKIKTKSSAPLNISEKYITLILADGIKAKNQEDLIDKISCMLNIKRIFTQEYVELLSSLNGLVFEDGIYKLNNNNCIEYDLKDTRILHSNVKVGYDDISYIYLYDINVLLSMPIVASSGFTNTNPVEYNYDAEERITFFGQIKEMKEQQKLITNLSVKNTLVEDSEITLFDISGCANITVNIPLEIFYEYKKSEEVGYFFGFRFVEEQDYFKTLFNRDYMKNYFHKNSEYNKDIKKPGFIIHEENVQEQQLLQKEIDDIKEELDNITSLSEDEKNELSMEKSNLEELKNTKTNLTKAIKKIDPKNEGKELEQLKDELTIVDEKYKKSEEQIALLNEEITNKKEEIKQINIQLQKKSNELNKSFVENFNMSDEYEKKLFKFYEKIVEITKKHKIIYTRYKTLIDLLLSTSKKINDGKILIDDDLNPFEPRLNDASAVIASILNTPYAKYESLKKELAINSGLRLSLLSKGIKQSTLDNLVKMEYILDASRHFDRKNSIKQIEKQGENFEKSREELDLFTKMSKIEKKAVLNCFIELFEQGIKKEENLKLLSETMKIRVERREQ